MKIRQDDNKCRVIAAWVKNNHCYPPGDIAKLDVNW